MKKRIILLIIILFLPVMVEAKEYCTIVSGNGKNIGSEIACGSEHFYVIDSSGENIKMLSKYNLYVGANYDKIVLDINKTYIKYQLEYKKSNDYSLVNPQYYFEGEVVADYDNWIEKISQKYGMDFSNSNYIERVITSDKYTEDNKTYINKTYKYYPYTFITDNTNGYALQNRLALGVTGEKGNANYPIYGTMFLFPDVDGYHLYKTIEDYDIFEPGYINFTFKEGSTVQNYLNSYKSNLTQMGYNVLDVNIMNIEDLNEFTKSVSNKDLPLEDWYYGDYYDSDYYDNYDDTIAGNENFFDNYYFFGDLKEFIPFNYSWLWDTTYWTSTIVGNKQLNLEEDAYGTEVYFISSAGELCSSVSEECHGDIPRAGLRPVVTISKDSIKYNIKTKTDGKGTIEVVESAYGGEEIRFRVTAKKEYKLIGLTITTDSGEVVEFNEEDIISNNDGTMSISTNKFTMPYDNVLIQARWASTIVNPTTGVKFGFLLFMLFIIDMSVIYVIAIRKRQAI